MPSLKNISVETLEPRQLMSGAANLNGREVYADFNGDGKVDVAVLNKGKVLFDPGPLDGKFGPKTLAAAKLGGRPLSIAGGDFNGDGHLDLSAFGVRGTGANAQGIIAILIGYQSGGGPTVPVDFPTESFRSAVITEVGMPVVQGRPLVGDFNGDGRDDLASVRDNGAVGWFQALTRNEKIVLRRGGSMQTPYRAGGQIGLAHDDDGGPARIVVVMKKVEGSQAAFHLDRSTVCSAIVYVLAPGDAPRGLSLETSGSVLAVRTLLKDPMPAFADREVTHVTCRPCAA